MDEGSTDSKVDDLLRYVLTLVERQKEEVSIPRKTNWEVKVLRFKIVTIAGIDSAGETLHHRPLSGVKGRRAI